MKRKHLPGFIAAVLLMILLCPIPGRSQMVDEIAKRRVIIGVGIFNDIWFGTPKGINARTINQGFQTFVLYRIPFGKSDFGFSIGLGFRTNNLYGNFYRLEDSTNDSTTMVKIPDSVSYKRSKLSLPYIELPIEFQFKSKSKVALAIGFKIGYLLPAHTKFVGDDYITGTTARLRIKHREIKNLEQFSYGPTLRIGYRWFHVSGYYSLSNIFIKGNNNPEMYPLSVGILLMPF